MPKSGRHNWADLIVKALENLGGEAHIRDIYTELERMPEGQEKFELAKSKTGKPVDVKAQIRCLISSRDTRFERTEKRGVWRLKNKDDSSKESSSSFRQKKKNYTLPARYAERSTRILKLMRDYAIQTKVGWAQKEIAKELQIDINAVNKLVNFMVMEDLLYITKGKGKTHNPFRYAPRDGVLEARFDKYSSKGSIDSMEARP